MHSAAPSAEPTLVDFAVDLAQRAGQRTLEWFRTPDLGVESKSDGTPVTIADRETEIFLRAELAAQHPNDGIVGEEGSDVDGTSGRRWILDPIDGTKSFTHGVPLFATLVALMDEHGPLVGVIELPALGETVAAGRGRGATLNGEPCSVTDHPTVSGSWLMTSGFGVWHGSEVDAVNRAGGHLRTWGDAYGYALVATGRADAMIDPVANLWDLAAPSIVVTEAGGAFTDLAGEPTPANGNGIGSNGRFQSELCALFKPERPVTDGP